MSRVHCNPGILFLVRVVMSFTGLGFIRDRVTYLMAHPGKLHPFTPAVFFQNIHRSLAFLKPIIAPCLFLGGSVWMIKRYLSAVDKRAQRALGISDRNISLLQKIGRIERNRCVEAIGAIDVIKDRQKFLELVSPFLPTLLSRLTDLTQYSLNTLDSFVDLAKELTSEAEIVNCWDCFALLVSRKDVEMPLEQKELKNQLLAYLIKHKAVIHWSAIRPACAVYFQNPLPANLFSLFRCLKGGISSDVFTEGFVSDLPMLTSRLCEVLELQNNLLQYFHKFMADNNWNPSCEAEIIRCWDYFWICCRLGRGGLTCEDPTFLKGLISTYQMSDLSVELSARCPKDVLESLDSKAQKLSQESERIDCFAFLLHMRILFQHNVPIFNSILEFIERIDGTIPWSRIDATKLVDWYTGYKTVSDSSRCDSKSSEMSKRILDCYLTQNSGLSLAGLKMNRMPTEWLGLYRHIQNLVLSHNLLDIYPDVEGIRGLQSLHLHDNHLQYVPPQSRYKVGFQDNPVPDCKWLMNLFNRAWIASSGWGSVYMEPGYFTGHVKNLLRRELELQSVYQPLMDAYIICEGKLDQIRGSLEKRGSLLIEVGWVGHAVLVQVFSDPEREDCYVMRIFNTGEFCNYHKRVIQKEKNRLADVGSKIAYLEWKGIRKQSWNQIDPISLFYRIRVKKGKEASEALYKTLKKDLGGIEALELTEHQRESAVTPQRAGNCGVRSLYACWKAIFLPPDASWLMHKVRQDALDRCQKHLSKGGPSSLDQFPQSTLDAMQRILDEKHKKQDCRNERYILKK